MVNFRIIYRALNEARGTLIEGSSMLNPALSGPEKASLDQTRRDIAAALLEVEGEASRVVPKTLDDARSRFSAETDRMLEAGVSPALLGEALIEIGIKCEIFAYGAHAVASRLHEAAKRMDVVSRTVSAQSKEASTAASTEP